MTRVIVDHWNDQGLIAFILDIHVLDYLVLLYIKIN